MKKKKQPAKICIIIAILLCLISAIGSKLTVSNGGHIKVTNIATTTDNPAPTYMDTVIHP